MIRRLLFFAAQVAAVCVAATLCYAQSTAQISGRITDSSEGVVPGATIIVTNTDTGVSAETTSNEAGYYIFPRLDLGNFRITARIEGFKETTRSGIKLDVNQAARIDLVLEVGALTERIEVVGDSPLLDTETAQLGTVVTEEKISDLPLNGRNFMQLVLLSPGTSPVRVSQGGNAQRIGIRPQPAINGQTNRSNSYTLDGVYNNAHYVSTYAVAPSIDSLNQFKVQSHSDLAEYGGVNGAVVNIASKSGTNEIHGTVYEFLRNDSLDARGFFSAGKTKLRQNQFGVSVGGPIVRNKAFFFFSYEGYREIRGSDILSVVPTPEELRGDFQATENPLFNPFSTHEDETTESGFSREPFLNNQIPESLIHPSTRAYAEAIIPKPINTGVANFNARNNEPSHAPADNFSIRLDHHISPQDFVWFRYNWGNQDRTTPGTFPGTKNIGTTPAKNLGVSYTHLFGANTFVNALFGFSSTTNTGRSFLTSTDLFSQYFPTFPPDPPANPDATAPGIGVDGYFGTDGGGIKDGPQRGWQLRADVSHIVGRHSIKFGAEFVEQPWATLELNNSLGFNTPQTADLNNLDETGSALASFMLGVIESAELANSDYALTSQLFNAYVQDTWKATDKLTINLGLRWDLLRNPVYTRDFPSTWDFNTGKFLVGTPKPPKCTDEELNRVSSALAAPCLLDPDDPYVNQYVEFTGNSKFLKDDYKMFGPRIGFAYALRPKTVVRGSGAIMYDLMAGVNQQAQNGAVDAANWPGARGAAVEVNSEFVEVTAEDPFGGHNPLAPPLTPEESIAFYFDPRFQKPYSEQWNLEIEHELFANHTLSVGYVGSHNLRMSIGSLYNTALTPGPGPVGPRALWPHAPVTGYDRSIGQSSYNGLQVKAERRFSGGLSYLVSYTWSKSIDVASSAQYRENLSLQNPYDPNSSRSVSGFDVPHVLTIATVYALPFGPGRPWLQNGLGAKVLGNWQFNVIAQMRSGQPFTPVMNLDIANIGAFNSTSRARPNLVGDPILENRRPEAWFDKTAFAAPANFTFGNSGRNILRSDGVQNFDLSLFREDKLTERVRMQIRAEFFNAFNHPDFGLPVATFTNARFGQVTSTVSTARELQFGIKLIF